MLHVHRAERADRLVGALATLLAEDPLDDPMATEVVSVPTRGIERWLSQELSLRLGVAAGQADGVCANVDFRPPGQVVGAALSAAAGVDHDTDPWRAKHLVWPLLAVVDDHLDEDWLAPLHAHLVGSAGAEDTTRRGRRYRAVRHVADLYDRYGVHRPWMVRAWQDGKDVDGAGQPLPADAAWQAQLWRRARARLDVPSPAERLSDATARLRDGFVVAGLPPRLALFGLTALPASYVAVLSALSTSTDVHLYLLHPSPALWQAADAALGTLPAARVPVRREADPTRALVRHPVLRSWGRDAREMQVVLRSLPAGGAGAAGHGAVTDHHHAGAGDTPGTLLARLQAAVRADQPPPGPPLGDAVDRRPALARGDRSLQVHACHGRTRQVEVLRDAILHLLADDPTLEPRDIVVACPDIEAFAPLVPAVFGAHAVAGDGATEDDRGDGGLPDLRVRLADRALRATNPLLRVVAELLDLADARLTASQVLDLAGREPVRRRFQLDDDALDRIEGWVAGAGIRWGLDGGHRGAFGLPGVTANTWRAGLDRVLLGVAMADQDHRIVGGAVPLDDVEGSDADVAGRLAEFVARLATALDALRGPHAIQGWHDALAEAADALAAADGRQTWQRTQLRRILGEVVGEASVEGKVSDVELTLAEARTLLADRLRGRPTRANHRTGDLTFCTLVPMRSVPHRVVCLLGLDDDAFPRRTTGDGDDLIERDPHVGDRDLRTEDRQLLLDALMAATDHLVVTYTGRDERTNERRPPAVPIGELLDVVDRTVRTDGSGRPASRAVVIEHPLQPYDARAFQAGTLHSDRPWGFDPVALAGARARTAAGDRPPRRFLSAPLAPEPSAVVELDDLVRFLEHPVKAFLRARLDLSLPSRSEDPGDAMPVALDALGRWGVGDGLLRARLAGTPVDRWIAAERARGGLPPGALADGLLDEAQETVAALFDAAAVHVDLGGQQRRAVEVDVGLPDGRSLLGVVGDVRTADSSDAGGRGAHDVLLAVSYSRIKAKARIGAWVRLLAATAAGQHERPLTAVTVARTKSQRKSVTTTTCRIAAVGDTADERRAWALDHLAGLVDLYDRGMREPLPLYCESSAAYAAAVAEGADWTGDGWTTKRFPCEDVDAAHVLVLGDVVSADALHEERPCEGEDFAAEEASRFGRFARWLWAPVLACEQKDDQ